jgi:hypothetical protein
VLRSVQDGALRPRRPGSRPRYGRRTTGAASGLCGAVRSGLTGFPPGYDLSTVLPMASEDGPLDEGINVNETESTPAPATPAYVPLDPGVTKPLGAAANTPSGRKRLVIISRTTLIMLFIAALAILGMGVLVVVRGEPPEVDGWLRYLFGRVFGVVALGLAVVLGVPSGIGLWAMAGSTAPDAVPALPEAPRRILAGVAAVTVVVTAVVLLVTGSAAFILNLGLLGIVGLAAFGLAGAISFSPHRWRAIASGVALVLLTVGTAWVLGGAFIGTPGA